MSDMRLTQSAPLPPNGCVICGSTKAPLLDTWHEVGPTALRMYFCTIHLQEMARAGGLIEGDEMGELLAVREQCSQQSQRLAELTELLKEARTFIEGQDQAIADLDSELTLSRGREAQVQEQLESVREATTATLAATQAPAPEPLVANAEQDNQERRAVTVPPRPEEEQYEPALD